MIVVVIVRAGVHSCEYFLASQEDAYSRPVSAAELEYHNIDPKLLIVGRKSTFDLAAVNKMFKAAYKDVKF